MTKEKFSFYFGLFMAIFLLYLGFSDILAIKNELKQYSMNITIICATNLLCGTFMFAGLLHRGKWIFIMQPVIWILLGSITIYSNTYNSFMGLIILALSLCLVKFYGLKRNYLKFVGIGLFLLSNILINSNAIINNFFDPRASIAHVIANIVIMGMIYFFVDDSYSITMEQADNILRRMDESTFFGELGKNIYSDVYHDFKGGTIKELTNAIELLIKNGKNESALKCVTELNKAVDQYNNSFYSVREEVIECQKRKPKEIDIRDFFNENKYKTYQISDYTTDNPVVLFPKYDLSGIIDPILSNANDFKNEKVEIILEENNSHVFIRIKNDGPPFDRKWRSKDGEVDPAIFFPNMTTKAGGTGWGMFSAYAKVKRNNAKMSIISIKSMTDFTIKIPKM